MSSVSEQKRPNDSKRLKREREILECVRAILADKGYSNFSMRSVAAAAGLHLKTVQYYFPTKRQLLTAALSYTLDEYYFERYSEVSREKVATGPRERFLIVIEELIADIKTAFTTKFFIEIWALAVRDEDARIALDRLYERHCDHLAGLIQEMNPTLPGETARQRATIVTMMLEGMMLFVGDVKPTCKETPGLDEEVKRRMLDIVMAP